MGGDAIIREGLVVHRPPDAQRTWTERDTENPRTHLPHVSACCVRVNAAPASLDSTARQLADNLPFVITATSQLL